MLLIRFTTPTEGFELRCTQMSIGADGILVARVNGELLEVATRDGDRWLVDTNWNNPGQHFNMLKRFTTLFVEVTS